MKIAKKAGFRGPSAFPTKAISFLAALFFFWDVQASSPGWSASQNQIEALRQTLRAQREGLNRTAESLNWTVGLSERALKMDELRGLVENRQRAMLALIEISPEDALQEMISPAERELLPLEVRGRIEKAESRTGALEVLGVLADDGRPGLEYRLITSDENLRLAIRLPDEYLTGTQLTVQGFLLGEWLVAEAKNAVILNAVTAPETNTTLDTRYGLLISINFVDNPIEPWTMVLARERFDNIADWYLETSYGQMTLISDVAGWFTINAPSTVCAPNTFRDLGEAAARAAGYEPSFYNHIIIAFPRVASCGWAGLGQVPGRYTWLNNTISRSTAVHELGHNLGLQHSHSRRCSDDPLQGTCSAMEYGDIFDVMGSSQAEYHASFRRYLGWIPDSDVIYISAQDGDRTVVLRSAETSYDPRVLRIQRATGDYLFVEAREAIGFDSVLMQYPAVLNGVTVYLGQSFRTQWLVDFGFTTVTRTDAPVQFGETLVDGDLRITPLYNLDGSTYVDIHFELAPK